MYDKNVNDVRPALSPEGRVRYFELGGETEGEDGRERVSLREEHNFATSMDWV